MHKILLRSRLQPEGHGLTRSGTSWRAFGVGTGASGNLFRIFLAAPPLRLVRHIISGRQKLPRILPQRYAFFFRFEKRVAQGCRNVACHLPVDNFQRPTYRFIGDFTNQNASPEIGVLLRNDTSANGFSVTAPSVESSIPKMLILRCNFIGFQLPISF